MVDWEEQEQTTVTQVVPLETGEHRALGRFDKALLIVLVGDNAGQTHVVEDRAVIGRSIDADIRIRTDDISRKHAVVYKDRLDKFYVDDLGSKNGTLVNGESVAKQSLLRFGDKIRLGSKSILMFSQYDEVEDQLLQAQRLESIGQLASGVAHDFNNILGAILANVGFLKGLAPAVTFKDREVQDCIEDIDMAAQRAVQISRQLLGLSRRDEREEVQVDVTELVHEVLALLGRTFERTVTIEDEVESGLSIRGDGGQLSQMLMNLCINGRDAMLPSGGTLTLRVMSIAPQQPLATGPQRFVEIMVRDTGSGMPQSVRQRIFDPFFTTKPKGKGTGLGLSTVLSIARQHGGDVEVVSEEGVGTTFRVHLPLSEEQEDDPMVELASSPRTMEMRRGMVLLVDDEDVFRNSARRLLEGLGYPVKTARDGIEAIQVFDLHKDMIELVILDMVMPNMDGEATYHALKKVDPSVRVLLSSGQTELDGVRALLAAGVHGFLQKPYDARTLGDAISRMTFGTRKWR